MKEHQKLTNESRNKRKNQQERMHVQTDGYTKVDERVNKGTNTRMNKQAKKEKTGIRTWK